MYETLDSTGEMKFIIKFCLILYNFSELINFFFSISHEKVFLMLFQATIYIFQKGL